jgi:hypothetical protein
VLWSLDNLPDDDPTDANSVEFGRIFATVISPATYTIVPASGRVASLQRNRPHATHGKGDGEVNIIRVNSSCWEQTSTTAAFSMEWTKCIYLNINIALDISLYCRLLTCILHYGDLGCCAWRWMHFYHSFFILRLRPISQTAKIKGIKLIIQKNRFEQWCW